MHMHMCMHMYHHAGYSDRNSRADGGPRSPFSCSLPGFPGSSVYDAIRDAAAGGILLNASDPNVYTLKHMLTKAGVARTEATAERWLTMQNSTFSPSEWSDVAEDDAWEVRCDDAAAGECSVAFVATPPTVVALWLRPTTSTDPSCEFTF